MKKMKDLVIEKGLNVASKEKNAHLQWELVEEKHLINDEWIDFRVSSWRFPNGKIWKIPDTVFFTVYKQRRAFK